MIYVGDAGLCTVLRFERECLTTATCCTTEQHQDYGLILISSSTSMLRLCRDEYQSLYNPQYTFFCILLSLLKLYERPSSQQEMLIL